MKFIQFSIEKNKLLPVLKQLAAMERSARKRNSVLEVTVKDACLELVMPGAQLQVAAEASGAVKFRTRLWYFRDLIENEKDKVLHFKVEEHALKIRDFTFTVYTAFMEDDRILRSIDLPLNYTPLDLARLYLSDRYTDEELEFNGMDKEALKAYRKITGDIQKIAVLMKPFGFDRSEIEALIKERVNGAFEKRRLQ
jgi:hypothetical protein